jgi:DNA-binding PadR family transcriptional regulator
MALEHALLVALSEQPASGLDLAKRFGRSIGFFWHATHQQIYRVLARMDGDGWVTVTEVAQTGKPDKKVYAVSPAGARVLADWLAQPTPMEPLRSELAVKMRGAAFGDRDAVLDVVRTNLAEHRLRLDHYEQLERRQQAESGAAAGVPARPTGHELDQHLVLRGGIRTERFWVEWLTEYLEAHA